ncbi:murein hydrolase activator EnvC [uncultured Eubacterium sp.]|uniref:murein hydrolase activator EnvC family protein n=1 Tax=uncultured Eubacterium sp. TaxID=165185 RepID=UPI0025F78365|nr:M23 family metallopeptidase [uncultured Eubacterium sp.]
MMKRRIRQITGLIMAATLLATAAGSAGASAASGSISDVRERKSQLENDLKDVKALISQLQGQQGDVQAAISELDAKLSAISEKIDDLEAQTEEKNKELADSEEQLATAQENEAEQYESMKGRIRYMYQNSGMNYLEALLEAGSFAELLKKVEYMSSLMTYDREKLSEYQQLQAEIQNAEEIIKQDKAELEALQSQQEEEQQAVKLLMQEKEQQLSGIRQGLSEAEESAQEYEQKIAAENQLIQDMLAAEEAARKSEEARKQQEEQKRQEELKKQQEDANNSSNSTNSGSSSGSASNSGAGSSNVNTNNSYTGGVFTWPCPSSTRITSGFGKRNSPTAGASSYHQGYDIGASSGAAVVAAADGIVTITGYSSVLGNYVILSHGGGLFTIYEHCSSVLVSKGQSVSRGSTIAKVGSTGISTGPHLHFGVQLNGKYVDPGNYL